MKPHRVKLGISLGLSVALVLCALIILPGRVWSDSGSGQQMAQIYQRLAALDGYAFTASVRQTTHPLPTLANVGLSNQTSSVLVAGAIDKPADLIQISISEQSGHLLDGIGQMELKLQAGAVWGRVAGQAWEPLDETAAPDRNTSDPAAFLQSTRNVQSVGTEERLGQTFQVYTFELDGAAWASLMRQELQAAMIRRGELGPNESLDRLEYYEKMTGQGELWLNETGLPQRLKFHAVYPPLPNETAYREVETITDYSGWQGLKQPGTFAHWPGWDSFSANIQRSLPKTPVAAAGVALLLPFLLLPLALVRFRSSRRLYRALILILISLFVTEPILSATVVQATGERRAERSAHYQASLAENDRIQAAVEQVKADFGSQFDMTKGLTAQAPQSVPGFELAIPVGAVGPDSVDTDADGLPDAQERELGTNAAATDSDGDGVDDASEVTLGLNPANPDTDGDLISDGFEVAGIQMGGKTWYLDPLSKDTNGDGILDSLECIQAIDVTVSPSGKGVKGAPKGTGICADTDSDGTPDFADDDNDNDGVNDWIDGQAGSRFGDMTTGVKDSTFAYGLDNYSAGKPLRVTFEVRPTDPQHLWYSMNVLDWPSGDYEGQIKRVHDTKLGTTGTAANGDMQLVPMIEVTLPGDEAIHLPTIPGQAPIVGDNDNASLAKWLDMDVLQRYQMAVSWTPDKQSIQIYLPATLIRDPKGNAPVNFVAKMLYWPNGSGLFSKNHTARLVWLVQMDVDNCVFPADSNFDKSCRPDGEDYKDGINWKTTKQKLVHRYYDSFFLTAFTAEEDLSANGQIFYENPAQVSNPAAYVPDQLLGLGTVLESYLRQKKSPTEALQAYKAKSPNLGTRLTGGSVIQDPDTFGLMAKIATQAAPALLDTVFKPFKDQLPYPTMLYVTWGESKVTGLAGVSSGDALRLSMSSATKKSATNIRLGVFTYNANPSSVGGRQNPNWDSADPGKIWTNYLQGHSVASYEQLPQTTQQKFSSEQFQQATLGAFWNLARGVVLPTDLPEPIEFNKSGADANGLVDEISAAYDNAGENTVGALIGVFDDFKEAKSIVGKAATQKGLLNLAGKDIKNPANLKGALKASKWAAGFGAASVTFAGASATISVILALQDQLGISPATVTALEAVNATIGAVLAGLQLTQEITKLVQTVAIDGLGKALSFQSTLSSVGAYAAVIVAALILVTALVMFAKLWLEDGDIVAAGTGLAQGVATAMVVLLLFVISTLFPIGTAIALLIGLLDGIFTAICKIANWKGGPDADGKTFEDRNPIFCKGIVGNIVAGFAGLFFKSLPMVDMAYKERLQFGQTDTKLISVNGLVGMNAGNLMQVTQPVTITVRLPNEHLLNAIFSLYQFESRPGTIGIDITGAMPVTEYDRLIKEKNVFNYELITDREAPQNSQLAELKTPASWKSVGESDNRNRLTKTESPTTQVTLTAGINWSPSLFVREYYSYSLALCGIVVGGCDTKYDQFKKFKGDTQVITIGTHLIYDVFPLNLTDFYTLEQVREDNQFVNKYRLAWGGSKLAFPTLLDADGDGLRGDLDPDDKTADTDSDGLPDAFEVRDFRLNARSADSDSDGLSDYQEMRRGTRPDRADTDGDGLSDNDEITGWELVYVDAANVTKRTWVTSDPLVFDTDGDSISDQQERVLGVHPRARNTDLSVLSLRTSTNQTGSAYLAPSQTIAFTSTVRNDLRKPVAYGLLEAEVLSSTQVINPITFELQPQQGKDLTGSIAAPAQPVAGSEEIILRNRAGANMVDPSASYADQLRGLAQPNGLKFQLNFEQRPADERNFQDVTGNATLTCPSNYCPSVIRSTDSYGTFQASNWYAATGNNLAFTQPRFSLGGWVTPEKPFGGKYDERVLFGPDNVAGGVDKYLQLSLVDMQSDTPKAKINFTATDDAVCEQVLTGLIVPFGQKTHVFVTYDGTLVHGYKNGQLVGSYNLQNCANKVPAGNRFTIGRGASSAALYVNNVYYRNLDEGDGWFTSAEPYLQLNDTKDPFANTDGIRNGQTWGVGKELALRDASAGDANSTVYLCEEDRGNKQGRCVSDALVDGDDFLGTVTIDPRRNGSFNTGWSFPNSLFSWSGNLNYNVQNNFFQGSLDDLRIYESTLTPQEVGQLINGSGLTFQLDEASGRTQFRNAGVDATQLTCAAGGCPTSGLKGYAGQAVRFGEASETLAVDKLRARFGSNLVVSFWFKPEAGSSSATPTPLVRFGQGKEGFTLFATNSDTQTTLRARFNETQIDTIGGSGGSDYTLRCNGDEALVGIFGRAGGGIDSVGPLCVTTNSSYQWVGSPTRRGSAGGSGGGDFERICQSGSFVSGFTGRSGGLVDQIQVTCAQPNGIGTLDSRNPVTLDAVGGSGGDSQSMRVCPSNLAANGVYGRAGGSVDSFGLTCQDQVGTLSGAIMPVNQWSHVALAQNNDSLLLYLNGQPVQNIWFGTSSRTGYRLTGSYSPDLVLGGGATGLLDEVQIQGLSVNSAKTASIGGSGGDAFELNCQANEALVGLYGRSGDAVDQVGPLCAVIDQNGQRSGSVVRRGTAGGSGGSDFERICAANSAMVGFQGRAGGAVDQLRPVCAPLKANGVVDTSASTTELSGVGGGGGSEQGLKSCVAGVPATGIFGRAGGAVDAFGLQCSTLLHEIVRKPFTDSAQVYLALDEVAGITTFVNSTGKGDLLCGSGVTCPQGGLKGQVRESLQFNNQPGMATSATPRLTVPNQPDAPFSFSTWVKLTAAPAAPASLVALHANEGTDAPAWRFQLINSGGQIVPQLIGSLFGGGGCGIYGSFTVTPANVNMALNQWHQLGVNYDPSNGKNDVSIYLNGRLIHQERVSSPICRTGTTLRFGQSYRGQMDEFFYYTKSLEVSEFLSQFVYQSTWYDVISTERFKVDYNAPTLKLTLGAAVKPGTNIFGVVASDTESGIRSVEYKDNDGVWKSANAETATTGVWAFGLDIQGTTLVEVRATDKVGNVKTDSKSVNVDSTPPTVALTTSGKQQSLTVQGTASDSGSGLQSATIMLIDPLGAPMNSPRSVAVVNGAWQFSQELPPVVNGAFQVWMSAVDQTGNEFKGIVGTVQVDNSPPTAGLIANRSDYTGVGANLPVIKGYVADQPYPEGMRLFIGFEDVPVGSTVGGTVASTLDLSGNQWQALPLPGTSGPSVFLTDSYRQAQFQLGQTLVITNANPQLGAQRSLLLDPNNLTLMAWINPASVQPGEQKILMQDDQAGFGLLLKGDQVTLRINRSGTPIDKDTGVRAVANVWQHLTVSFAQIGQTQQTGQTVTTWLAAWTQNPVGVKLTLSAAERINTSSSPLTIGAATNGYAGQMDDIIVYSRPFSELEARQLANSSPSNIQKIEVGFLHRKDKDDATKVVWRDATLDRTNVDGTTWQLQAPADLEGIYDISLRASDALDNQRTLPGVWTGLIDTQAPRIALSGATPGQQACTVTDFSLGRNTFLCADTPNATNAASALYAAGSFTAAGLTWDAAWYSALYRGRAVAERLYALRQTGVNFTTSNVAESCDIYGNCTRCTVTANDTNAPICTVSSGPILLRAAGVEAEHDNLFDATAPIGPGVFTATLRYERPDAYVPGTQPGAPTSEWVTIDEPYTLIADAVLASTRPFAASFTEAQTEIEWGESISATEYYVGWTVTETAVITDLTYYAAPGVHIQSLADKGRYYAHVIAVDAEGETNALTMGPVYFDGATPASYLNWDEFGPGQPYWLWQDALSATGQACNVLGQDDRAALFSGGASARSGLQTLYGTWNNEWLALHWDGVNLENQGDLHLYIDSKAGGALYAYNPYAAIAQATSLVVMPERRQYQSNAVDRMLADFAVIVEDAQTVRLMQWNGSSWQDASLGQVKFSYANGEAIIWLSLAALGVNPNAVDVSLVGFVTEENNMQVWATMPGNNPLNSPSMLPSHQPAALDASRTLLNLQTSMRLSSDSNVNNTLDNCPTNVLFDQSILDVTFTANPAAETYDPAVYDGIRAVVPDDVESLLAGLCAGVSDISQSPVCQLAKLVADNAGGGGPEVGPLGMLPANAGPGDTLTFYATVRNLSNQATGDLTLELTGDLPSNGTTLAVGFLAPLESKVISFTETVAPGAAYDHTVMTIYPVEKVENSEESITLTFGHAPHTVIHDIDRSAPISAELTSLLIDDLIGVGEQLLEGLVYDQSPLTKVTLQTSLGETVNCADTLQVDAFANDWACAINVPANTPDGTIVQVSLSAEDIYGFASGVIGQWSFEVDNLAPQLTVFGAPGLSAAGIQVSANTTETLLLEGVAGDERWLGGVQVCDTLQGFETCQEAEMLFFSDVLTNTVGRAALAVNLADEAAWSLERMIDTGIEGATVPFTVTAYDAAGNGTQLNFAMLIDTLAPTVTLSAQPVTQIAFDGAFSLDGSATDRSGVSLMELEVIDPLGEYSYYPITLNSPDGVNTRWGYTLTLGTGEFVIPGEYAYVILAHDALGNEREVGPYTLTVGAPAQPWLNAPIFVATSNDLWTGFAPGAPLYMQVQFDDDDLSLGDAITVTVDPFPAWLVLTRLDERTVEISGTVPLTITQAPALAAEVDERATADEIRSTVAITIPLQINVGMTLSDSTGRQAYRSWVYELGIQSGPHRLYFPFVRHQSGLVADRQTFLPLAGR